VFDDVQSGGGDEMARCGSMPYLREEWIHLSYIRNSIQSFLHFALVRA
jgi:hypothetical protein